MPDPVPRLKNITDCVRGCFRIHARFSEISSSTTLALWIIRGNWIQVDGGKKEKASITPGNPQRDRLFYVSPRSSCKPTGFTNQRITQLQRGGPYIRYYEENKRRVVRLCTVPLARNATDYIQYFKKYHVVSSSVSKALLIP